MKNSAFVDPCPRDLLGKQWLFMHMSSHYRRMCSAQSVVDSAPPASLRARAAPRSASRTQQARLSQRPSRADTDPGPGTGARASLGLDVLDGRASASRRQFEYNASVLRKPPSLARHRRRDVEKQGTYYDKLNQLVPDHMPQKAGLRTNGQILSEVFTPRVPHKPQVLRTEVSSRLRFSSTYCPPRSKSNRTKTGVAGQAINKDKEQPVWLQTQTSPPVSSRDSAYNGGISSGGESRGPTPEHKGTKKQAKKAERKSKRLVDHKQTNTTDASPKRKFESKLMNKLLEEERNEIQEQRLRVVDPWRGLGHDDHGDEILRNIQNLHLESNEEYSSIEHGNPSNNDYASDQSIEEDMVEEANESEEAETNKDDDVDDSLIRDSDSVSTKPEETPSPKRSLSSAGNEEADPQTDAPLRKNNLFDKSLEGILQQSTTLSHSVTSSSVSEKHLNSQQSSHSISRQQSVKTPETEVTFQESGDDTKKMLTSDITQENSGKRVTDQGNLNIEQRESWCKLVYAKFLRDIAAVINKEEITTHKGVNAVCDEYIKANCDKLDKGRMLEEVKKFQSQLEVPREKTLDEEINADLYTPHDVKNLTPLVSNPSEIWDNFVQQQKSQINNSKALDGPLKFPRLGLGFGNKFDERIALSREHMIAADDELTGQKVSKNESIGLPVKIQGKECDLKIEAKLDKVLEDSDNVLKMKSSYLNSQADESKKFSNPSLHVTSNHFSDSLKDEKMYQDISSFISPTRESNLSSIPILNAEKANTQDYQLTSLSPLESKDSLLNGQFVVQHSKIEKWPTPHLPTKDIRCNGQNCRCQVENKKTEDELDKTPERKTPEIEILFSGKTLPSINTSKLESKIPTDRQEIVETEIIPFPNINTPVIEENCCLENNLSSHSQDSELLVGTGVNSDIIRHVNSLKTPLKVPM